MVIRHNDGTLAGPRWATGVVIEAERELAGVRSFTVRPLARDAGGRFEVDERSSRQGDAYHVYDRTSGRERAAVVTFSDDGRFVGPTWAVDAAKAASLADDPEYGAFLDMLDRQSGGGPRFSNAVRIAL